MDSGILREANTYSKARRRQKRWYQVVRLLAAVVVFVTTYALILPAITMETYLCGLEEHTHTSECYVQTTSVTKRVPVCSADTLDLHVHTDGCFRNGEAVCGYADFVVHRHESACLDEGDVLWCTLPQIAFHTHSDQCYPAETVHSHTGDCYALQRGELICTEEVSEAHSHGEDCYSEVRNLSCTLPEDEAHQHEDACFTAAQELVCQIPEAPGHQHEDSCYAWEESLVCTLSTEPGSDPEPNCGKAEIVAHTHDSGCFDGSGVPVCGKLQVVEHRHSDSCFQTVEVPLDTQALTCGLSEGEEHVHGFLCYGSWELVCTRQEHLHSEECRAEPDGTEPVTEAPTETDAETLEPTESVSATASTEESTEYTQSTESTAPVETTAPTEPTAATEAEQQDFTLPSGGPVLGSVYAEEAVMKRTFSRMLAASPSARSAALNVANYVTGAQIYYRTSDDEEWTLITSDTKDIPGNASFKLVVKYENVNIDTLQEAGNQMTFTLPKLLRNPSANGQLTSSGTTVGSITASGDTVTLTIDETWLNGQETQGNTVISGDFFVEAELDLTQATPGSGSISIGGANITLDFADDLVAQYGNVDITKTVSAISEEESGDYLTYTLTVTAGVDGCPEVRVVDTFTANQTYIDSYVGVTGAETALSGASGPIETGAPEGQTGKVYIGAAPTDEIPIPVPAGEAAATPGTMVWNIGNMAANENRTLTYRVKLKEGYIGALSKGTLTNESKVFSKTYSRDSDAATFTPKAGGSISKTYADFVPDETGGGTITYTVWVSANADNSYTLDNVCIRDALDGSLNNTNATPAAIRKHLEYDTASFALYLGGTNQQNGSTGLASVQPAKAMDISDYDSDGKLNDHFTYYVGSLAPGESRTLTYTVKVPAEAVIAAGNDPLQINNRAEFRTKDDGWLNGYNHSYSAHHQVWNRKLVGDETVADASITMSGSVYDATGGAVTQIANPESSFTVPAGSYLYQVVANEDGDWNLSSTTMADTLSGSNMTYVGYVRVDAYTISSSANPSDSTSTASSVVESLQQKTPAKTVWLKVDGETEFSFQPSQLGLTGEYAYLLTYYAQPRNLDGITLVVVNNDFELSGSVGYRQKTYTLNGIQVNVSVTVEGTNSFAAEKMSWYYDPERASSGDFVNGTLYWVIKVDGQTIPAGTKIKDTTNIAGGDTHYIRGLSWVGAYVGSVDLNAYPDMGSLSGCETLQALEIDPATYVSKDNESLTVTLPGDVVLADGQSLYIIVKTEPNSLPGSKRDTRTFNNTLTSSSDGNNWVTHNVASKTLYGSENIIKELGRVFIYNDGTDGGTRGVTGIQEGTTIHAHWDALGKSGTFVAWQITLNYEGNLSGRYRIVENIPEGMTLAYMRIWQIGSKVGSNIPYTVPLSLGDGWTAYDPELSSWNVGSSYDHIQKNYYYSNGQQVIWEVDNLLPGNEAGSYAVEFQIVCRVTDEDVLLGNQSKYFNNTVTLLDSQGNQIGSDSNGVSIQRKTLGKVGTYDPDTNGGRYPFRITLNDLGEDLIVGGDTITLVDEMSETLILDPTSIQVVNTKTNAAVTGWTSSVVGNTLKIVLPDNLPLTITYQATVNAMPGQKISISNSAHWEGYQANQDSSVSHPTFAYSVGGTVGSSETPSITIRKRDRYNAQNALAGATFSVVQMEVADGKFIEVADGFSTTGTTDANGAVTIRGYSKSNGDSQESILMQYNTIYRLRETAAPSGYILDAEDHYFAVAKPVENGYPTFPAGVTVWYQSADYTYTAYNHRGEATVSKQFDHVTESNFSIPDGEYRFGIFAQENPPGSPLQTVTITYQNNVGTPEGGTAKFHDLELGKDHYIYELDDYGNAILPGQAAKINGGLYIVTYSDSSKVTPTASQIPSVTVTNQFGHPELPETGGSGTQLLCLWGIGMMLAAAVLFLATKRRSTGR